MKGPPDDDAGRVLAATAMFGHLGPVALGRLAEVSVRRRYDRGEPICRQGEPGEWLFVIVSGLVKVVLTSEQGDQVLLATYGRHETLGELATLDRGLRSASVTAVEPTTILIITRAALLDVMAESPIVLDAMLLLLGNLVRRLTEQAGDFVFLDLGGRLAKVLLRLARSHGIGEDEVLLDVRLSQSELAAMVGASRPALNRALQMFASRGWVTVDGQTILIKDMAALEKRAAG